jgi:predicted DNA-binding transcriptional regulator AlpA
MQKQSKASHSEPLPAEGLIGAKDVLRMVPFSIGTLRNRVADGTFPKPRKIGHLNFWDVATVRKFVEGN